MKKGLVLLLCIFVMLVVKTEGLSCYDCTYYETQYNHEGEQWPDIEDSCASGKTPMARLSVDCSTLDYWVPSTKSGHALGVKNVNATKGLQRKPPSNAVFTCVTFIYNGKFDSYLDNFAVKGVFRGCLMSFKNETIDAQCHQGKLQNLLTSVKEEELLELLTDFDLDEKVTDVDIRTCNDKNCNVEAGLSGAFKVVVNYAGLSIFLALLTILNIV